MGPLNPLYTILAQESRVSSQKGGARTMENNDKTAKREVFCRYIHRNGKVIYPKNARFFHFFVDDTAGEKLSKRRPILRKKR